VQPWISQREDDRPKLRLLAGALVRVGILYRSWLTGPYSCTAVDLVQLYRYTSAAAAAGQQGATASTIVRGSQDHGHDHGY
jgi:hypothetical protein